MVQVLLKSLLSNVTQIGANPDDTDEVRLQKTLLVLGCIFLFIPTGSIWGVIYLGFGELLAGAIPLSYSCALDSERYILSPHAPLSVLSI